MINTKKIKFNLKNSTSIRKRSLMNQTIENILSLKFQKIQFQEIHFSLTKHPISFQIQALKKGVMLYF